MYMYTMAIPDGDVTHYIKHVIFKKKKFPDYLWVYSGFPVILDIKENLVNKFLFVPVNEKSGTLIKLLYSRKTQGISLSKKAVVSLLSYLDPCPQKLITWMISYGAFKCIYEMHE